MKMIKETHTGKILKVIMKGTNITRAMKIVYKKFLPDYQKSIKELLA